MRREPPYPSLKNFILCGLHFAEECFERDLKVSFVLKSSLSSSRDPICELKSLNIFSLTLKYFMWFSL